MKKLASLVVLMVAITVSSVSAANPKPFVIPELTSWKGGDGEFTLTSASRIVPAKGESAAEAARALAADYATVSGRQLAIANGGKAKDGDIALAIKADKKLGAEGYTMKIGKRIEITAATPTGLYWATRTLLQLAAQNGGKIPCGTTTDVPRYAVRGLLFDVGRKYVPLDYLKKFVKMMSYYKMNTLQVHLNDDAMDFHLNNELNHYGAFRIECSTYPGLTARDGSYTKAEFRQFQKDAAKQGVTIVPEFDSPAHSSCFIKYDPTLRSKDYDETHLDLLNPHTYEFMDALWKEYLSGDDPVFVGKVVSIGTDEYSNRDSVVVEAFRKYTDHYIRLLESYGKTANVWGALTHAKGKTPVKADGVIMNLWYNGYANPKDMIAAGYKGVSIPDGWVYIVPMAGYYRDYLDCKLLYDKWTPNMVGDVTFAADDPAIIGGMYAVWNDKIGNGISVKDIHHRLFPPLQTMATKCWTAQLTTTPWTEFSQKSATMIEAPGVNERAIYGRPNSIVFSKAGVSTGEAMPIPEIGYNYTVEFTLSGATETPGTELFRSPNAVFYLADPVSGLMGFARDGYLYNFDYLVQPGSNDVIRITGDNMSTKLYVNGKLRSDLSPRRTVFQGENKDQTFNVTRVSTLVFPLAKSGNFKSKVSDLKVYNYIAQ